MISERAALMRMWLEGLAEFTMARSASRSASS
jgi:hypothetical protein